MKNSNLDSAETWSPPTSVDMENLAADIRRAIRENGYWTEEIDGCGYGYADAVIRCIKRGYALIQICRPYGGSAHFAVREGNGAWHTRGLDVAQAQARCPRNGVALREIIEELA